MVKKYMNEIPEGLLGATHIAALNEAKMDADAVRGTGGLCLVLCLLLCMGFETSIQL